jgi:gluconokinase
MMSLALSMTARKSFGTTATPPLVLALDIGTSSVRGALYDEKGSEIEGTQARVTRSLSTTFDGGAELEAVEAIEQTARTIDEVLARSRKLKAQIETVAISCFWHSLVGIDDEGQALTPLYGWADTRAARFAEELRQRLDERAAHARTGCRFHPSYWPARFLWLRTEHDGIYGRVRRWMSFAEFLSSRFLSETRMSLSMASGTGLLDVRSCLWDEELLEATGIAREQLPVIAETHEASARLKAEYARRWPRLREARWFPAIGDGAANNIGAGCMTRAEIALMIGTSGAMRVLWKGEPPLEMPPALWCYRADRRRVLLGGALSDGGGLYSWMTDALALSDDPREREDALAALEPDAHGLTVLPFWAGERSTNWSTRARGSILGLSVHTRPIEILRAAMEAIAYRFALIAGALDPHAPAAKIIASGGALTASPVWSQMLADVLGRPVYLTSIAEASGRGACLLALEARGLLKSIENSPAPFVQIREPDMARHTRYRAGLERQEEIYSRISTTESRIQEPEARRKENL